MALAATWIAALHAASRDETAPSRLIETGLYGEGQPGVIDPRNRPFSPQYPLWSDGAAKSRWVYLPPGAAIDARDAAEWQFPAGTRFWKEFSFNGRKVETRFLWRTTTGKWIFATYIWNEEQTDAVLAPEHGARAGVEVAPGRRHEIPGATDCQACHGAKRPGPLGFNALQLSTDRDPNAIHGEPLAPGMIDLATLVNERRLDPSRRELVANPPRIPASSPATRAVLGYFAVNCGTCHNRSGETTFSGPSLKHGDLLDDGDAVARNLASFKTSWQVPGQPEGSSLMINPTIPDASAMLVRMRSRRPSSQMPPLGTVLRDDKAIAAVEQWIATDSLFSSHGSHGSVFSSHGLHGLHGSFLSSLRAGPVSPW
jgi:mono/diheme cytochrome c family protein